MEYDTSRIANFGRDAAAAYRRFIKAEEKLVTEINAALDNGVKPIKIAHDVMGRCQSHEDRVNLMSALMALAKMEKIPESVVEPFEKGIRPRRV